MEDLTAAFSGSVGVSFSAESSATQHPRMGMYKTRESKQSQWERRKEKLRLQREKRRDYADVARKLAEEDYANITLSDEEEAEIMETTSPTSGKKRRSKGKGKKKERYYSNQLMLSEWLDDVPTDLAENWLMVPCPVGRRTFIITSGGITCHYTKSGYCMNRFPSALPGGSAGQSRNKLNYTILDCIYSEIHRTYWVLDCMCWHGHPVYDSETEFRFFWLQSKLAEFPELATGYKKHPMKFLPLPVFKCEKQILQDAMTKPMPFQDELDGLLFYHKALHYTPGVTPLVGWLKPWMLPEILDVPIPDTLMAKRPPGAQLRPPSSSPDKEGQSPKGSKTDPEVEAMDASSAAAKSDKKGKRSKSSKTDPKVEAMDASSAAAKSDKKGQGPKSSKTDPKVEAMDASSAAAKSNKQGQRPKSSKTDPKVEAMDASSAAAKSDKKGQRPKSSKTDPKVEAMDASSAAAKSNKQGQHPKSSKTDPEVEAIDASSAAKSDKEAQCPKSSKIDPKVEAMDASSAVAKSDKKGQSPNGTKADSKEEDMDASSAAEVKDTS